MFYFPKFDFLPPKYLRFSHYMLLHYRLSNRLLHQTYSAALIILGACYKMLLYEFIYASEDGSHRMLLSTSKLQRWLAGGEGDGGPLRFDKEDREQRIAYFFCGSMAAIWFCLDLMILSHRGLSDTMKKCKAQGMRKVLGVVLILMRIALIAFMATLCLYVKEGSLLSLLGMVGILAQLTLRVIGTLYIEEKEEDEEVFLEDMRSGFITMGSIKKKSDTR